MKKIAIALLVAGLSCSVSITSHAAKLKIGVEGAYPPFSEIGADGKIKGFDIDIANALCAEMKAECALVKQDFDGLIPGLLSKQTDAVVASMSITEERKRQVDFTDKYYQTPARLIAKSGSGFDPEKGVKGKRIGVERTTTHDRFATATFLGAEVVRFTKQDDAYADLAAGKIDAVVGDLVALRAGFLNTPAGKGFQFVGPSYIDPKYFGTGVGIPVRKADTELRDQLNAAIKAIRANGVYKKIQSKYFDFDVYGDGAGKK